jgi:hypothetical protein
MLPPCFHDMRMERYHHAIVVCHLAESACMSELARVLVRFDHVARLIVNANHCALISRLISSEKLPGVCVVMIFVCPRETAATL